MAAKEPALRRHPAPRRLATLVATVVHLSASSIDDCLELFDVLMVTELLGKGQRETEKHHAAVHPRLARASAKLAAAVRVLLEASAIRRGPSGGRRGGRSRRSFRAPSSGQPSRQCRSSSRTSTQTTRASCVPAWRSESGW
jgi:hypothetical protein